MPTKYYLPNAQVAGWGDLLTNFAAQRRVKEEIESTYQAQAKAEQNQAWADAASSALGGAMGGIFAGVMGGGGPGVMSDAATGQALNAAGQPVLSSLQRLALSSSFLPGGERMGQTALQLSGQQLGQQEESAERAFRQGAQERGIQAALQLDAARTENDLYSQAVSNFEKVATSGSAGRTPQSVTTYAPTPGGPIPFMGAQPGGMPMTVLDPSTIPLYRQAQDDSRDIINEFSAIRSDATIPVAEKSQRIAALTPRLMEAQRVLAPTRPPPPPTSMGELQQSGALVIGDDGSVAERQRDGTYNYKTGPKTAQYDSFVNDYTEAAGQRGTSPVKARQEAKRHWIVEQLGGQDVYDEIKQNGGVPYADKDGSVKIWEPPKEKGKTFDVGGFAGELLVKAAQGGRPISSDKAIASAEAIASSLREIEDKEAVGVRIAEEFERTHDEPIDESEFSAINMEVRRLFGADPAGVPEKIREPLRIMGERVEQFRQDSFRVQLFADDVLRAIEHNGMPPIPQVEKALRAMEIVYPQGKNMPPDMAERAQKLIEFLNNVQAAESNGRSQ